MKEFLGIILILVAGWIIAAFFAPQLAASINSNISFATTDFVNKNPGLTVLIFIGIVLFIFLKSK